MAFKALKGTGNTASPTKTNTETGGSSPGGASPDEPNNYSTSNKDSNKLKHQKNYGMT